MAENDDDSDNAMRDVFLSTGYTITCTVQFKDTSCEEVRKNNEVTYKDEQKRRIRDAFMKEYELKWRREHEKCSEDAKTMIPTVLVPALA